MPVIRGRQVGGTAAPYVVAEISGNHGGSLERALHLVDVAADAGADAIKLQTYTADTMTLKSDENDFRVLDSASLWSGRTLHDLYEEASTPWEWHRQIFEYAKQRGVSAFSTPFDDSAVDFLEDLNAPCYKISSFEITHLPLIRRVAQTKKPLIISTGMATLAEIDAAVDAARGCGCQDLILLKCTSAYPSPAENANLSTIPVMAKTFGCDVGISDHSIGIGVAVAAVALGAVLIEKHITLDTLDGAVDSPFSMEPQDLVNLVVESKRAWQSIGEISFGPTEADSRSRQFRRSVYIARDLEAGHTLNVDDLRIIRPSYGLKPDDLQLIVGRVLKVNVRRGTAMTWDLV